MTSRDSAPWDVNATVESKDIKLRAYRVGGGGNIEFTLPCGQKRRMTRSDAGELVKRIQAASAWLTGTTDSKEF